MAAKAGIFDLIFKSGAKAAKEVSKGTGAAAKKAPSNMKVLPRTTMASGGNIARSNKYYAETGRPRVVNGRPLPPSMMRPTPKKAAPVKKMSPARPTSEEFARMGKAEAAAKAARMPQKPAPAKKAVPVKKAAPGRVSPETARKLAVLQKNATYAQRKDAVRRLPAKPPVKKFR